MRPLIALSVVALVAVTALVLASDPSAPVAEASFHEVRIYGVMGGSDGDTSSQFIELRQASGGQNQVQNAQLCFYDADGVPWARFVFPSKVDNASSNDSILVGTSAMAAAWNAGSGAQPDFIFSAANTTALNGAADVDAPIPIPNGNVVYESKATDTSCGSPNAIDSIGYGTGYNGVAFFGDVFETDLPSNSDGFQLETTPVAFPPTDNSTEYQVAECIVARNNDGQEGTVGDTCGPADTPTPSPSPSPTQTAAPTSTPTVVPTSTVTAAPTASTVPTSTATPTPSQTASPTPSSTAPAGTDRIWGNVDCDDSLSTRDNQAELRFVLQQNPLTQTEPCPDLNSDVVVDGVPRRWGDEDCDGEVTTRDNQSKLRFVLQQNPLGQTEPCPDVGTVVRVAQG